MNFSSSSWLLWQLADSAFPMGGFGHSGGLEAAWKHGEVRTNDDLVAFLRAALWQMRRGALPIVKAAHQQELPLAEIDWLCEAFISNHIANRASRAQGQALLGSAERGFGGKALKALKALVVAEALPGHLPPLFGSVTAALEIQFCDALRLFVFTQLRGLVSAAVRLGIVGPFEGQAIQHSLIPLADQAAGKAEELRLENIAQSAPLLDLFQGTQDRLYSRLFQS